MSETLEQDSLFEVNEEQSSAENLPPGASKLLVHFLTPADRLTFSALIGQPVSAATEILSFPVASRVPADFFASAHAAVTQSRLLESPPNWQDTWRGMPAYSQQDLTPYQSIYVYFESPSGRAEFARVTQNSIRPETKSVWFPRADIDDVIGLRWRSTRPQLPKYPVYVPTKGRWESGFTIKCMERLGIPYFAVVQPQEAHHYAPLLSSLGTMLLLPAGLDGLVPTRNWIMEHSIAAGAERHWQLDDNIKSFFRYHENRQIHVADGTCMRIAEDFADRYENIAIAGFQYFMFVPRKHGDFPPYVFNTRVYSNSLINNSIPFRYRDVYNDDTDICLRALKANWCTVQYNAFLAWKQPTMIVKGGNTPIYLGAEQVEADWQAHAKTCKDCSPDVSPEKCDAGRAILQRDGRWRMADSLLRQHPDVTRIVRKWNRWQHSVDYRQFKGKTPRYRPGVVLPEGQDEYGLELVEVEVARRSISSGLKPLRPTPVAGPAAPAPAGPSPFDFLDLVAASAPPEPPRPEVPVPAPLPPVLPKPLAEEPAPVLPEIPAESEALPEPALQEAAGPAEDLPDGFEEVAPEPTAESFAGELRARGHRLLTKDGRLFISEASKLTEEDRELVKVFKPELIALAEPVPVPAPPAPPPPPPKVEEPPPAIPPSNASLFATTPSVSLADFIGSEPPRVDPDYKADEIPNLDGIDDLIINFETNGLRWWENHEPISATVGTLDGKRQWFLPWGFAGGNLDKDAVVRFFQSLRNKRITNANTKFEVHMGRKVGIDFEAQGCTVSDVQHYAALLDDNRKKFNIDLLATEFLGGVRVPRVDESRMATYHASEVAARARYQVELVAQLRAVFWPKLDAEDLQHVRQLEDNVIYPVCEMERNGAPLDVELLERWVKESQTQYEQCLYDLSKEAGGPINPNSPLDLEKLFHKLQLPVVYLESGSPSFTDAILKTVQHPLVKQLRFAVKLSDLRSRYLLKYQKAVGADGILRYALHQTRYQTDRGDEGGTGPGRFSSSELDRGVGCNIQQVMKVGKQRKMFGIAEKDTSRDEEIYIIRRLMVPRTGEWLCADAEQIEYRMFGHYAGNEKVFAAYKENPRTNFHSLIEGYLKPFVEVGYDDAKTLNFATIYGSGQVKQATMLGFITEEQGAEISARRDWNSTLLAPMKNISAIYNRELPEVKPLLKRAGDLAASRGFVKTLMGRRSRFNIDKRYHKALNNVIQGGAADYNKVKLVEVHKARSYTGLLLRFSVHDEMDGDAQQRETLERVREVLDAQSWPEMKIPLLWDVKTGRNWAEAK